MVTRPRNNQSLWGQADPDVFDQAHLARYTMESEDLEREIVELFLVQLPESVAMLTLEADAAQWRFAAHALKGSAAAVGAHRVEAITRRLEAVADYPALRQQVLSDLQDAITQFRTVFAQSQSPR